MTILFCFTLGIFQKAEDAGKENNTILKVSMYSKELLNG